MTRSLELDCAPFHPRPSDLIGGVLKDTGFTEADFDTGPPLFGNQKWVLKDEQREAAYDKIRPTLKERVSALYHAGSIRYGSW